MASVALLVATTSAAEPRNSIAEMFPVYNNGGYSDLTVDPQRFTSQMEIIDRTFEATGCELLEGSVNAAGVRRILRFDTVKRRADAGRRKSDE